MAETRPAGGGHAPYSNPEVSYERSDIEARGVLTFVAVLAAVILLSGALLAWLFNAYQSGAERAFDKDALPLANTNKDRLPVAPRLEGIDPSQDAGRAWPGATQGERPLPWFGYNVRVVPPDGSHDASADEEERERIAAFAMARKLEKIDSTMATLAGKLPARPAPAGLPPDVFRRSAGDGNSGRSAGEKAP
jgi:hypothetical protein